MSIIERHGKKTGWAIQMAGEFIFNRRRYPASSWVVEDMGHGRHVYRNADFHYLYR